MINGQDREPLLGRGSNSEENDNDSEIGLFQRVWKKIKENLTKKPMTNEERLMLDPWQKWKLFNRIPLKGLLHLLLVIVITVQIILRAEQFGLYERDTWKTIDTLLANGDDATTDIVLFTRQDVLDLVQNAVHVYYDFPKDTSDRFVYAYSDNGTIESPIIVFQVQAYDLYNTSEKSWNFQYFRNNPTSEVTFQVSNETTAIIDVLNYIEVTYYRIRQIQINFMWRSLDLSGILGPVALSWTVKFYINLESGSTPTDCYLDARSNVYAEEGTNALTVFFWLFVLNILLSLLSLVLSIKALVVQFRLFLNTRERLKKLPAAEWKNISISSWADVPLSTKLQFFDLWHQVTVIGNVSTIVGCVLGIIDLNGATFKSYEDLGMGLGAWFMCFNLLRYFEYNQRFFMLIGSVRLSFWRSMTFLLSVLPIFYGFALLGLVNFSQYTELFLNLDRTSVTLYAMMNGDNIVNAFDAVAAQYPYTWFTRLYLYSFTLFFITAVLNTFIFTLEEGFFLAKTYTKFGTFVSVDPKKLEKKRLEKEKKKGNVTTKKIDAETLLKAYDALHMEVDHNSAKEDEAEEEGKALPEAVVCLLTNFQETAFQAMEREFAEEMEAEIERVKRLEERHRERMLRFVSDYVAEQGLEG